MYLFIFTQLKQKDIQNIPFDPGLTIEIADGYEMMTRKTQKLLVDDLLHLKQTMHNNETGMYMYVCNVLLHPLDTKYCIPLPLYTRSEQYSTPEYFFS